MNYNLKDKIEITEEFLNDLIAKSWQETKMLQQQITNIDTSTQLGKTVVKLLKDTCTNHYILIGCLEALAENPELENVTAEVEAELEQDMTELEISDEPTKLVYEPKESEEPIVISSEASSDFEPFEYFVDFDEPSGEPLSDKDLYGN